MKYIRFLTGISIVMLLLFGVFHSSAQADTNKIWADSLRLMATSATDEHGLQYYLDSLGYDIDVENDELGWEIFCGQPGLNSATLIIEVAGSAVYATSGYYRAGNPSQLYQLFGPTAGPGDSVQFNFSSSDSFGFYMKPNLPGEYYTWLSETDLNSDHYDHAWVYATGVPHEYLICWEDLPNGGDMDYQDLVIKVVFTNLVPDIVFAGGLTDTSVVQCSQEEICFDISAYDNNCQSDSIWLEMTYGEGSFTPRAGLTSINTSHCFTPTTSGTYTFTFEVEDILGASTSRTFTVYVEQASSPQVELNDTNVVFCEPAEICLPVSILDPDCDIDSVNSNLGSYSGTISNFDQIAGLNELGAMVTQINGGADGKVLYSAADFVPPVNSLSGVNVTLPNFIFAGTVVKKGSFSNEAAGYMLGSPTDLTFTNVGAGGPDGGNGDGSTIFNYGNWCRLGFNQDITTCNGARVDFIVFTNTSGSGTAELKFMKGSTVVYTLLQIIPGGTAGSGSGGVKLDLPDGLTFNRINIKSIQSTFEVDAVAARTSPSSSLSDICFNADTSGTYEVIVTAYDHCGNIGADTAYVTVTINNPPVADAGSDKTYFVCQFEQICFNVSFTDPDDNLDYGILYSGPGTLNGNQICYTPTTEGTTTFIIKAVDDCGAVDYDTVKVTINKNAPPVANNPSAVTQFMCQPQELCHTFTASDPNGGTLTWALINGQGNITPDGHYCFTPAASGTYNATVTVSDSCGAKDTTWITYNITINSAPVANNPTSPFAVFQCAASEICYQFTATDVNGGTLSWTKASGDGTVSSNGLWCFTPAGSGSYAATVVVTDSCGAKDTTGLTYNVTVNEAPTIAFGNDTSLTLCAPQPICLNYQVSDPQGLDKLVENMVSGFGTIDTANNKVCFTPTTGGTYEIIVGVTDSCNAYDVDTVVVNVTFDEWAVIDCPTGNINVSLCEADTVCQLLNITPASATVTVSNGVYRNGEVCFYAGNSGTYNINVIAATGCGADTCLLTFNVDIGQAAQIDCPEPGEVFICQAGNVCIPVGVVGGGTVTVSPIGTYSGGNLCFPADTTGHYEITMIASTACGVDTCVVIMDVTINSAPVAVDPVSPVDTFLCNPGQICYQFQAADVNGGTLTWNRVSGNGTVSSAGLWCFNAAASGTYTVTARVTDSCGAFDDVILTYNIEVNSPPVFSFGNDTTLFVCSSQMLCVPYTLTDANDNIQTVALIAGNATLYPATSELCFTPAVEGLYQFIVRATDSCGVFDEDTINVNVDFNTPPLVNAGADQTVFQCEVYEICWPTTASDPDNNLTSVELVSSPGTFDGTNICFTPSVTMNYEFILKATDDCGAVSYDTVVVYYTLNIPPVANAGADQTLFQCTPAEICWPASCSDANGNLSSCTLVEGPGSYNGSNICFTPAASGLYTFVLEAVDACGRSDYDTAVINVTINSAPVCVVPDDTTIFKCATGEVCLPAYGTDIDGNLDYCQIISGPGSLVNGQWCYTPAANQTVTVLMKCVDDCGAVCQSQFTVNFEINKPPTIAFGNDTAIFLCELLPVCLPYSVYDPNDPRLRTVSLVSGSGTLDEDNSQVCFTPTGEGLYTFIIKVEDECAATDYDTINVNISVNTPPVAQAGENQSLFLCDSVSIICWPASCSDADGNLENCLFNGPGDFNGSEICFNPVVTGNYLFTLKAIDDCGEERLDTVTVAAVINSLPQISFGNDTAVFLCGPNEICVGYEVYDPDGLAGLKEHFICGYGTIDTVDNRVCFTPTESGVYEIIVGVTDSCTALPKSFTPQVDTIKVTVTFGEFAKIDCPDQPYNVNLCAVDEVCQMLTITPGDAIVTTSFGTYIGGDLCFQADTSGTYNIRVIAEASCGADTCDLVFNVNIGEEPQIDCPAPQSKFICTAGTVCIPVGVMGAGAVVSVSPIGTYTGGNLCFPADTSGHYELQMIATTDCGADTCLVLVDIDINSPPIADDPASPVDTFICNPVQICYQFTADDADGGSLTWNRLAGVGTVNSSGLWCFDANGNGTYAVTVVVTDACGAKDTTGLTYNISLNSAPVVTFPADTTIFLCSLSNICIGYTVSDVDDNLSTVTLVSGDGTLNTVDKKVCFDPPATGSYQFIIEAVDACNASDRDTINVNIQMNRPPVITFTAPEPEFLCVSEPVCQAVSVSDPDNNLDSAYVSSGPGTYHNGQVCFTPAASGDYFITITAVDKCGAAVQSAPIHFAVTLNSPPVCIPPNDTTFFQCQPYNVTLVITSNDVDDNFDHCEIISGPGSINGGYWSYAPTTNENVKVVFMCLDDCGAFCKDSFLVNFEINRAPVVNAGNDTTYFLCHTQTICRNINTTDINNNIMSVEMLTPVGTFDQNTGELCFVANYGDGSDKTYNFIFKATDSCGAVDYDTLNVGVVFNSPPVINAPPDFVAFLDQIGELCFDVTVTDKDNNLSGVTVAPFGTYNGSNQVCFTADTTGIYCFKITATDDCGQVSTDSVCIEIQIDECVHVQIEKVHKVIQGQYQLVDIFLNGSGKELGGYDFLIAYDASALIATRILPGNLIETCGWEYFSYRFGPFGNCSNGCPTGLLRIVALAETNNGAYHPGCFLNGMVGTLASIEFLISNDRTLECQFVPISFFWIDCADNSFASRHGDTMWVDRTIYDFEFNNITNHNYGLPGYYGVPNSCLIGEKIVPMRCVDFINGGIDIICADSIDLRGDINLNGIAYEISDAVMLTNYFVFGLSAFGQYVEGAIAASDVNADGLPLTVADLVYLIRVIINDAQPFSKPIFDGSSHSADFEIIDNVLTITSATTRIGALHLVIEGKAEPTLHEKVSGMEMLSHFNGENTRIIIYNMKGKTSLDEGPVLVINGPDKIKNLEAGSFDGQVMTARIVDNLPKDFTLSQNYPNPFNPITTIEFTLPEASEWKLTVYNILGRVVETWSDQSSPGYYKIEWDASRYASGVYFYRLMAGKFSATKKMVLLK